MFKSYTSFTSMQLYYSVAPLVQNRLHFLFPGLGGHVWHSYGLELFPAFVNLHFPLVTMFPLSSCMFGSQPLYIIMTLTASSFLLPGLSGISQAQENLDPCSCSSRALLPCHVSQLQEKSFSALWSETFSQMQTHSLETSFVLEDRSLTMWWHLGSEMARFR